MDEPLATRAVTANWGNNDWDDASPGRRLRVFARLVTGIAHAHESCTIRMRSGSDTVWAGEEMPTYGEAMTHCETNARERFGAFPLGGYNADYPVLTAIPDGRPRSASLPEALQDLADEIQEDIAEACETITNPKHYYPGVPEGIDPVSDEHVRLVVWGLQRVLDRELRFPRGGHQYDGPRRPAVPLAEALAWPVQRAIAERRRLRYQEWGITREGWQRRTWSLWDVPLDADYEPRRALRGRGRGQ